MKIKQDLYWAFLSATGLLAGFALLQLLLWLFVTTGSYVSGFHGHLVPGPFSVYAIADHWNRKQVVFLYLFPFLAFCILWLFFMAKRKVLINKPLFYHLFVAWGFLLLLVKVLFFPFWQIMDKNGLYHALSWLGVPGTQLMGFGVLLLAVFMLTVFNVSSLFVSCLYSNEKQFLKPKDIFPQLVFLWFIPILIFSFFIYLYWGMRVKPAHYLTGGIVVILLINLPVISKYKVIVK